MSPAEGGMVSTAIALFTRDLRVRDNPVLSAAARAERVVPLFVLDENLLQGPFNRPNRMRFLLECLTDLRRSLKGLGGDLVVRSGDPAVEVARLVSEVGATEVHVARDVSTYSTARQRRIEDALNGCAFHVHDAVITAHPAGELVPASRDHFAVFTPYFRRWSERPLRDVVAAPGPVRLPSVGSGDLPGLAALQPGEPSPDLPRGGERPARRRLQDWLDDGMSGYSAGQDDLGSDATSRLSPYLHFGCLSPVEIVARAERAGQGDAFVRQLAWRDFHHQVLAARPHTSWRDYRTQHDRWRDDPQAWQAWQTGRTGIPIVDAGMRQLSQEGWMHNRARLITASFLTKTLYLDWRLGARHFLDVLVDGDIANNNMNWQWVAGTGTDTRPNRVLNPIRQAHRYDPRGDYVRHYVPELADLPVRTLHEPYVLDAEELARRDYPAPIVDPDEANRRFRAARGKT